MSAQAHRVRKRSLNLNVFRELGVIDVCQTEFNAGDVSVCCRQVALRCLAQVTFERLNAPTQKRQ